MQSLRQSSWLPLPLPSPAIPTSYTFHPLLTPPAGRFAFVEFASEELATQALTLDKTELFGKGLKIARPSGYMPPAGEGRVGRAGAWRAPDMGEGWVWGRARVGDFAWTLG